MFSMVDRPEDAQLNGGRAALKQKWINKDSWLISFQLLNWTGLFSKHPCEEGLKTTGVGLC